VYAKLAGASLALRGPGENVLAHLHGLAWLAVQALRPDLLDADPVIPAATRLDATAAACAIALVAALAGGIVLLRRRPAEATALLWTVLWLPLAGLFLPRPEPANDRQLYLALLGPAWLLARGAVALGRRLPALRVSAAAAPLALAAVLALATAARNGVYADEIGFWRAALARSPANARALNNLGFALAARCRLDEAEEAFERAAAEAPKDFVPRVNLRLLRAGEPLGEGEPRCEPRPPPP
jgi:tetratricopeptide (TPR) repeat protein